MDWLKELIKNSPHLALILPTSLSAFTFFTQLMAALSDGVIDDNELHQLMSSASGVEMLILIIITIVLRNTNKKK